MKAKDIISDEEKKKKLGELLKYEKSCSIESYPTFMEPKVLRSGLMRMIIVVYSIVRLLYKAVYFYLLPYLIIPLSYYTYSGNKSVNNNNL